MLTAKLLKKSSFNLEDGEKVTDTTISFSDGLTFTIRACPGYYTEKPEDNSVLEGKSKMELYNYYLVAKESGIL